MSFQPSSAGLVIRARSGKAWRWIGSAIVTNRRGEDVRVERWQAPCRYCGTPFTMLAKLPGALRRRYSALVKRAVERGEEAGLIELVLPASLKAGQFER